MGRTERFQRNTDLEALLQRLNALLQPADEAATAEFLRPQLPVVLVVGAPRSGTTLMLQWLAATQQFAYPSNLLARFYAAPYLGALINRLIGDPKFNYGNELFDHIDGQTAFCSDLGKTQGMFEPSEFWYFWRRFIPNDQAECLTVEQLGQVDTNGFVRGIAALQAAYEKPWAMKGIILQYNLALLDSILPHVVFIWTRRDLDSNARSLLQARQRYFGDAQQWFSVRPPGFEQLLELSPAQQVVGQVELTNRSLHRQLQRISPQRSLQVEYQRFCEDPGALYQELRERLEKTGYPLPEAYLGPESFQAQRSAPHNVERDEIAEAIDSLPQWLVESTEQLADR